MSQGNSDDFPDGLKIGIYSEICRLGIDPHNLSSDKACKRYNIAKITT